MNGVFLQLTRHPFLNSINKACLLNASSGSFSTATRHDTTEGHQANHMRINDCIILLGVPEVDKQRAEFQWSKT